MFRDVKAFSGFSVDDTAAAKRFYGETLGLEVTEEGGPGLLGIRLGGGATVLAYPKDDHVPAEFTILNFPVDDLDASVEALEAAGVALLTYPHMGEPDDKGVYRSPGGGPDIAWFNDPAGNVLAVMADPS